MKLKVSYVLYCTVLYCKLKNQASDFICELFGLVPCIIVQYRYIYLYEAMLEAAIVILLGCRIPS